MFLSVIPVSYIVLGSFMVIIFISLYLTYGFYQLYMKTNKLLLEEDTSDDALVVKSSRKMVIASFIVYWILVLPILGYIIMIYVNIHSS